MNLLNSSQQHPCCGHPFPAQQSPQDRGWVSQAEGCHHPRSRWGTAASLAPQHPSPQHRQETTASACRQADNGHPAPSCLHPPPPQGGGTQPAAPAPATAPQAQGKEGVHPHRTQWQPHGTRVICMEQELLQAVLTVGQVPGHAGGRCAWTCYWHDTQPHVLCVRATWMWLVNPTDEAEGRGWYKIE